MPLHQGDVKLQVLRAEKALLENKAYIVEGLIIV